MQNQEFKIHFALLKEAIDCKKTGARELTFIYKGKHLIYSEKAWNFTRQFAAQAAGQMCEKFELERYFDVIFPEVVFYLKLLSEDKLR